MLPVVLVVVPGWTTSRVGVMRLMRTAPALQGYDAELAPPRCFAAVTGTTVWRGGRAPCAPRGACRVPGNRRGVTTRDGSAAAPLRRRRCILVTWALPSTTRERGLPPPTGAQPHPTLGPCCGARRLPPRLQRRHAAWGGGAPPTERARGPPPTGAPPQAPNGPCSTRRPGDSCPSCSSVTGRGKPEHQDYCCSVNTEVPS